MLFFVYYVESCGRKILPVNHPKSLYNSVTPYYNRTMDIIWGLHSMVDERSVDKLTERYHNNDIKQLKIFIMIDFNIEHDYKTRIIYKYVNKSKDIIIKLLLKDINEDKYKSIINDSNNNNDLDSIVKSIDHPPLLYLNLDHTNSYICGSLLINEGRLYPITNDDGKPFNKSIDDLKNMINENKIKFKKFYIIVFYEYSDVLEQLFLVHFIEPERILEDDKKILKMYYFEVN